MTQNVNDSFQLTTITQISELCKLRDLYLGDWPQHCVGYYCIDNFIRWLQFQPYITNLHFYTLNDDWRSNGLCLIVDRYQLFVNSLNGGNDEKIYIALSLLDWSNGYKISSLPEMHYEVVHKIIRNNNLNIEYDSLTLMYYMPKEEVLKLDIRCPEEYELRPLLKEDAKLIDDNWPNRHEGSLFLIRRLIAWNANMGVYDKETKQLVSWCLRLQGGFLGALQTMKTHKRLGLGSIVTKAISHKIAELGHDAMALVNGDNLASRNMFEKLGFKVVGRCYWIRTFPINKSFVWSDND